MKKTKKTGTKRKRKNRGIKRNKKGPYDILDYRNIRLHKLISSVKYKNPKCYASELENCDSKISQEHYFSKNILDSFGSNFITEIPYIPSIPKNFHPRNLSVNCLCKTHNSFLSPLDQLAGHLYSFISSTHILKDKKIVISGRTFEKWLAKALYGYIATNTVKHGNVKYNTSMLPNFLLNFIFNDLDLPSKLGLYIRAWKSRPMYQGSEIGGAPLFKENNIAGMRFSFAAFEMYFIINSIGINNLGNDFYHHMNSLNFNDRNLRIKFEW